MHGQYKLTASIRIAVFPKFIHYSRPLKMLLQ